MSEVSALVQPEVTTCRWSTPNTYQDLVVREHAAEFQAAEFLYGAIDEQENSDKLSLLKSCRTHAWFIRHSLSGEVRVASNSCKLRWCPLCAQARQNYIASEVAKWFCRVDYPKLMTLTLRHTSAPLKSQVDFLYRSFQKFRKRKFIANRLRGGVWFFQVKKSEADGSWHPHIHCLIDSDFLEHKQLMKLWAEITKGSTVIDIRAILDTDKAVKHNARYCATPAELYDLLPWNRYELFECFKGRRLAGCWGTAKEISLRPTRPPDSDSWISIGSWSTIIGLAGEDDIADEILEAWRNKKPLLTDSTLLLLDKEITGLPPPTNQPLQHQQYVMDFYARA